MFTLGPKPPQHSTREILRDWDGKKALGHNPSWIKVVDHERIVAELLQALDDQAKLHQPPAAESWPADAPITFDGEVRWPKRPKT